ncbi:hypothetical protein BSL78_05453 [Apostichopus japonicus]|uniref:Uncharacterized protein n=1 Tax=Stichopus japonicus TaxID=307972 RepID=A0A2G8LBL4_STIJA|nr:hypothetical protein BSL78_05453 [Apostichopus japonicus]
MYQTPGCEPLCLHGGVCRDGACQCPQGIYGEYCQHIGGNRHIYSEIISPFSTRLRIRNSKLSDGGLYVCGVGPKQFDYTIVLQDPQCEEQCRYGGNCENGFCECMPGFIGEYCEIPSYTIDIVWLPENPTPPVAGSDISLECVVSGDTPDMNPIWHLDNQGQPIDYEVSVIDSMTTQITLRNLDEGRLGTLVCQMGPLTSTVEIEVEAASCYVPCLNGGTCVEGLCECLEGYTGLACQIQEQSTIIIEIIGPSTPQPRVGDKVDILCRVPSNSSMTPIWIGPDGNRLPIKNNTQHRVYMVIMEPNIAKLMIKKAAVSDGGTYTCILGNEQMTSVVVNILEVECSVPCMNGGVCVASQCECPSMTSGSFCQNIIGSDFQVRIKIQKADYPIVGSNIRIVCEVKGSNPDYQFPMWYSPEGNRIRSTGDCFPECLNGAECQYGSCFCTSGFAGQACEIDVGPRGVDVNLTIIPMDPQPPFIGGNNTYICIASSNGLYFNPTWRNPEGIVITTAVSDSVYAEFISPLETHLIIANATEDDAGLYKCTIGPQSISYHINVLEPECDPPCLNGGQCIDSQCDVHLTVWIILRSLRYNEFLFASRFLAPLRGWGGLLGGGYGCKDQGSYGYLKVLEK